MHEIEVRHAYPFLHSGLEIVRSADAFGQKFAICYGGEVGYVKIIGEAGPSVSGKKDEGVSGIFYLSIAPFRYARVQRIEMDVMRQMSKMGFTFQKYGFELPLKKRSYSLVFYIEIVGVSRTELAHKHGRTVFHPFLEH